MVLNGEEEKKMDVAKWILKTASQYTSEAHSALAGLCSAECTSIPYVQAAILKLLHP